MLILIAPGDPVFVSGMSGGAATVVKQRGSSVRVSMVSTGKERTVDIDRLSVKPAPKALTVGMASRSDEKRRAVQRGEALLTFSASRPVPKPVTLTSDPYLAYVRQHPCCLCGSEVRVVPSHWGHHGASMSKKVDDYRTIPLCDPCHIGEWHRTGTFPGMDRVASEAFTLRVQRELLLAWTATRLGDGDMVDALIRAIGGQS